MGKTGEADETGEVDEGPAAGATGGAVEAGEVSEGPAAGAAGGTVFGQSPTRLSASLFRAS